MKTIAVVGGGISGISAAHYAAQQGYRVDLFESSAELGGRIGCTTLGGRAVEFGGKNIGLGYTRFRRFTAELGGVRFEPFGMNSSREVDGQVVRINKDGSPLRTLLQTWRLCGTRGLAQLLPHVLAIKRDPQQGFVNTSHFRAETRQHGDAPLSERFSPRCTANLIRTLTVRMNGAEPDECHFGNFGSNLGLLLDKYEQTVGGMHEVIDAFAAHCTTTRLRLARRVTAVTPLAQRQIRVSSEGADGLQEDDYEHVLIALPAGEAAALLAPVSAQAAGLLREVRYFPVAVAIARYRDDVFTPDQRAMVFPPDSPLSNAGAYGVNDLNIVRYTFSGRAARTLIGEDTDGQAAVALAEARLARHFHVEGNPRVDFTYRRLPTGLCAYSPNHAERLDALRRATPLHGGITLTGDYWRGASIEACFRAASEAIERLRAD